MSISPSKVLLTCVIVFMSAISNDLFAQTDSDDKLAQNLIGTWVYEKNLSGEDVNSAASNRIKSFTGRYWQINQSDPETGKVIFHHGGTYAIKDGEYTETILYANENTMNLVHQSFMFKIKIEDDTMTQIGEGNTYNEVWKRAD